MFSINLNQLTNELREIFRFLSGIFDSYTSFGILPFGKTWTMKALATYGIMK